MGTAVTTQRSVSKGSRIKDSRAHNDRRGDSFVARKKVCKGSPLGGCWDTPRGAGERNIKETRWPTDDVGPFAPASPAVGMLGKRLSERVETEKREIQGPASAWKRRPQAVTAARMLATKVEGMTRGFVKASRHLRAKASERWRWVTTLSRAR